MLHEPIPGLDLDDAAMEAFGIDPRDVGANRNLMEAYDAFGFPDGAIRFAKRVLSLAPGDTAATRVFTTWSSRRAPPQITVPVPHD